MEVARGEIVLIEFSFWLFNFESVCVDLHANKINDVKDINFL